MGLLDKLWDDTMGGPQPEKGVGKLRKLDIPSPRSSLDYGDSPNSLDSPRESPHESLLERRRSSDMRSDEARRISQSISIARPRGVERTTSLPASFPGSPSSAGYFSPALRRDGENVWRSVFNPGSNKAMEHVHAGNSGRWDSAGPKSPSVYDWYNRMD